MNQILLSLLAFVLFQGAFICSGQKSLKLGLITPPDGLLGYERVAAASTMALTDAKRQGYLANVNVSVIWKNGMCDGKQALGRVVDLWDQEDIDGFFGLPCSIASINAGKIIAYWDLPHLSYSSVDPALADKIMYNTLVRLISPYNRMADAMVEVLWFYDWYRVVLVMMPDSDHYCDYAGRAFSDTFEKMNITVAHWLKSSDYVTMDKIDKWLTLVRGQGRIVVICAEDDDLLRFMMRAHEQDMTNDDYVYITPSLLPADNLERRWKTRSGGNQENHKARAAYGSLLQMTMDIKNNPAASALMSEIPQKMSEPPWNYNGTLETGQTGSLFALFLYDCVYLYAMLADDLYKQGISPRNGSAMFALAKGKTFQGKSGTVTLDSNGDRISNYKVYHLPSSAAAYRELLQVNMTGKIRHQIRPLEQRNWGDSHGLVPPPDRPTCGFVNEKCAGNNQGLVNTIVATVVVGFIAIAFVAGGVVFFKKKSLEHELHRMLWKINFKDLVFVKRPRSQSMSLGSSVRTVQSSGSGLDTAGGGAISHRPDVAQFKGILVSVTSLLKTEILLDRSDQLELKLMKDMSHDNIHIFVGACVDPPDICTLFKYCSKGSLQDILLNEDIKLDLNFKKSFMMDIVQGMEYIHRSVLKSHGRLTSSSCMVDSFWIIKVSDWGPCAFREHENETDKVTVDLFKAPELLRQHDAPPRGTQKGDIYSFSILLQELLYRCKAYEAVGHVTMVPKDLVGRVRNGETPPFRPVLPENDTNNDLRLVNLMTDCWMEDPTLRPDFTALKSRLTEMNKGKRYNIMDNVLKLMEKYTNNLEELVGERTRQLTDEKKKTDMLLYRMLPSPVADGLKLGKTVEPELFKEVTVYFSDIVSFTTMASRSSPLQVVDFLNDLWTLFDDIIGKHDVYKVETIGDAYMVASGLPVPNTSHVVAVANMSLDILSSVLSFRIRHRPDEQLKIRIGIHSGPVVAGVVGQTMPRYCLFGDTVNTASRMESSGTALRIHVSQRTNNLLVESNKGFQLSGRGEVDIKGLGYQNTYWLDGRDDFSQPLPKQLS